ncbi:MAG: O-antigen ligase family protein [Candidatus Kerfeldbacteria bacterium]|nr:O-antigen ligase family protein [Candidatus Kerfeldbacteria bacterium]
MDMLDAVIVIIFAFIWAYLAWRMLDWAVTLVILFLPVYLIRFNVGPLPMTLLELMVIIVVVTWSWRAIQERSRTHASSVFSPWRWLLIAWVVAGVLAVAISPDVRAALGLWKAYIIEPALFFIVFVNTIKTRQQVRGVVWALGVLAVVIGFVTLLQYTNILSIPGGYGLESPARATGMFPFPTAVGKIIGPIMGLFLGLLFGAARLWRGTLWETVREHGFVIGVLTFSLVALLFSVSRGAIAGVLVSLVVVSFFSRYRRALWAGLLVMAVAALMIPAIRSNIMDVVQASDVSTDVRLVMWKGATRIIQDHPVLGTGLASFPVVYGDYKEASHTEFFPNPDHLWLSLWIEMGLAGVVIFCIMMVRFFQMIRRALRQADAEVRSLAIGLMAAMIVLLVHGLLDTPYFKNDLAIQFWTLIGLAVTLRGLPAPQEKIINS